MKNIISTFSRQSFNVLIPDPMTVKIEDIAHALSLLCRANGHFNRFYCSADLNQFFRLCSRAFSTFKTLPT